MTLISIIIIPLSGYLIIKIGSSLRRKATRTSLQIAELINKEDIKVFHSGTCSKNDSILSNGGRVLCVTALGDDLNQSNENAYRAVDQIDWDGKYFRKDIGWRVI